jgi:hypothetical protein
VALIERFVRNTRYGMGNVETDVVCQLTRTDRMASENEKCGASLETDVVCQLTRTDRMASENGKRGHGLSLVC